jgi:RNA polymerase sigma-70 factor (ECF subfamily)
MDEFNQYRPLLFSIAYNMLGSVMDAEDMIQETYVRYLAAARDGVEIRSVKNFCSQIITNLCIDLQKSARVRRETYIGPWLPEPIVITDYSSSPDETVQRVESLSIALLTLLESLSPIERAVYLLRKVFDYEYAEISRMVDREEAACRQIVSRAQKRLDSGKTRFDVSREDQEAFTVQFFESMATGDFDGLMNMLAEDIVSTSDGGGAVRGVAMRPISGRDNVARFLIAIGQRATPAHMSRLVKVNGQPGVAVYYNGEPFSVHVLHIVEGRVQRIFNIVNPEKLKRIPRLEGGQS